jgi:hypothetical protein
MAVSKRQTTRAKMDREQAVRERRARKQQKRDDRKQAATAPTVATEDIPPADAGADEPAE